MSESSNDTNVHRRTVLKGAGAAAAAWTAATVSVSGVTANDHGNGGADDRPPGMLVLVYDDSPREDYTKVFPVHQEFGVPGCAAVCPGLMGTHAAWMHPGHLNEMHQAGWEVMSHTLEHRALGEIPVRSDIERGDTEIHVQSYLHGAFAGDPLLIFDGDKQTTVTVADRRKDGDDQLIVLEDGIDESFAAGNGFRTWVRYTDEFTQEILSESKAQLEEWGFGPVTSYVHTYDRFDGYVSEILPEYYDAVPNRSQHGLNPTFRPDPYRLGRTNYEDTRVDEEELGEFLDTVANEPDFGILYGHSNRETFTQERIRRTIEMAHERDIEIVTLQEALARLEEQNSASNTPNGNGSTDDSNPDPQDPSDDPEGSVGVLQSVIDRFQSAVQNLLNRLGDIVGAGR